LLKSGIGGSRDIPVLFIAVAESPGLDARIALCSSWSDGAFKKDIQISSNLPDTLVAVKVDGQWKFYDPAAPVRRVSISEAEKFPVRFCGERPLYCITPHDG